MLNAHDCAAGLALTCGGHVATKLAPGGAHGAALHRGVGLGGVSGVAAPASYCSARAMVPVLRNRWVYFEVSARGAPRR